MKNAEKTFTVYEVVSILVDLRNDLKIEGRNLDLNNYVTMEEYENYGNSFTLEANVSEYDVTEQYLEIVDEYIQNFAKDLRENN